MNIHWNIFFDIFFNLIQIFFLWRQNILFQPLSWFCSSFLNCPIFFFLALKDFHPSLFFSWIVFVFHLKKKIRKKNLIGRDQRKTSQLSEKSWKNSYNFQIFFLFFLWNEIFLIELFRSFSQDQTDRILMITYFLRIFTIIINKIFLHHKSWKV